MDVPQWALSFIQEEGGIFPFGSGDYPADTRDYICRRTSFVL